MEPLGQGAIRFRHRGDLREHFAFPVRLARLQLPDALLHRGSFLVRESLGLLGDRGVLLGAHRILVMLTFGDAECYRRAARVRAAFPAHGAQSWPGPAPVPRTIQRAATPPASRGAP